MAIYSLNVTSVGKTTHQSGTAGAHIRYISRDSAEPEIIADHMPSDPNVARAWMNAQELADRKNARICDKIRIAIPIELTQDQRAELVRDFCKDITGDRVAYFAAIHQTGKDAHNPHAHIVIRDRDIRTGKRVLKWSDNKRDRIKAGLPENAVDHIRERWEVTANHALEMAGHDVRIDRRSLDDQGIDRIPTIHVGPNAKHVENTVQRPTSKNRFENAWWRSYRDEIPYEFIDAGRTRQERNAEIVDLNIERAMRSPDFATRERAKLQKDLAHDERILERDLISQARQQTYEVRQVRAQYREQWIETKALARDEIQATRDDLAVRWRENRTDLKERHDQERADLQAQQSTIKSRFIRFIDITGRTRAQHNADKRSQQATHAQERYEMRQAHNHNKSVLMGAVEARYKPALDDIKDGHNRAQLALADRHEPLKAQAEQKRQDLAHDRVQAERQLESALRQIEKQQKLKQQQKLRPRMR